MDEDNPFLGRFRIIFRDGVQIRTTIVRQMMAYGGDTLYLIDEKGHIFNWAYIVAMYLVENDVVVENDTADATE